MIEKKSIRVVFEDEAIVVINKAAGLPVHATHDPLRPHVQGIVERQLGQPLTLFHRLDLDTTGLLVLGKDPSVNAYMTELFRERQLKKTYLAVVDGRWPPEWTEHMTYIKKITGGRWANVPSGRGGARAHTHIRVLASNANKSLLELSPLTGRTHQLRLHCADKRHPILGDKLYSPKSPSGSIRYPMALHAWRLSFLHPTTKKSLEFQAELPSYWPEFYLLDLNWRP